MAKHETIIKAPQFGIRANLKTNPGKETPAERIPAERKESAKDVRDPDMASANATPSFWYPKDLDLPEKTAPKMAFKTAPKIAEKRKVEVIVRKKRNFSL
ncbi:hypothetical protein H7F10_13040 [Acidithiobacillus sp. HP-6]|jgi:hypothetical protein|uniref:hypothetical protein n=1 Tax=unclassified Acidithiobacillus TaxID=2614800 RepID=UPI001879F123|nr:MULTISPECIES: hypothetical protein [unclassified Acidithiobacillus]MBE7563855.1 hypothetical protein [Acidithiobacillus sp. HP-6]MBE7565710.1 hypothetical protein [Acidithiobacillus sp. HP-11]MBE7570400.1 hypothetical protein [Acidithiobacillus sp. HP-2]